MSPTQRFAIRSTRSLCDHTLQNRVTYIDLPFVSSDSLKPVCVAAVLSFTLAVRIPANRQHRSTTIEVSTLTLLTSFSFF